jgi:hypothetical protein
MKDTEKSPEYVTEPPVEAVSPLLPAKTSFLSRLSGRANDPNVLGKELLERALEFDQAQLERDAIKVRRKLDFIVIPMVCLEPSTCRLKYY